MVCGLLGLWTSCPIPLSIGGITPPDRSKSTFRREPDRPCELSWEVSLGIPLLGILSQVNLARESVRAGLKVGEKVTPVLNALTPGRD